MRTSHNSNSRIRQVDRFSFSSYPCINPYHFMDNQSITIHWSSKDQAFEPTSFPPKLLSIIKSTGQRPSVTISNKGVAQLGIRKGSMAGIKVTLRRQSKHRHAIQNLINATN